jgi:hypothetical protein
MSWIAETLWDLLKTPKRAKSRGAASTPPASLATQRSRGNGRPTMRERYDALVIEMKTAYGVRVVKWRTSSSGCAWEVHYHDGRCVRLIESPRPRGPISCAIFLHEIGHHAIGFGNFRPRCLEEYHAWRWALRTMETKGFNVTPAVRKRMDDSLRYAVRKARRRGLRRLPTELLPYLEPPARPVRTSA